MEQAGASGTPGGAAPGGAPPPKKPISPTRRRANSLVKSAKKLASAAVAAKREARLSRNLLRESGVDSVKELRARSESNLLHNDSGLDVEDIKALRLGRTRTTQGLSASGRLPQGQWQQRPARQQRPATSARPRGR